MPQLKDHLVQRLVRMCVNDRPVLKFGKPEFRFSRSQGALQIVECKNSYHFAIFINHRVSMVVFGEPLHVLEGLSHL